VISLRQFRNLRLHGGFLIKGIELTDAPIVDAIGREAIAQTSVIAREFRLLIRSGLSEEELSITVYLRNSRSRVRCRRHSTQERGRVQRGGF
jgi:hypothetical protein